MKQDFEQQVKEMSSSATPPKNGDFTKQQTEGILTSPEAPDNGDFTKAQQESINAVKARGEEVTEAVPERTNYEQAISERTGSVSEQDSPRDPNVTEAPQSIAGTTQTATGNTPSGTQATTKQPASESAPAPHMEAILTPTSDFEGKRKSFFNPDIEKGFFATLDKKMQEALRGGSPEEIAQNMAIAALTLIFEMIANACDHDRKEFQRLKEEYLKKVAENDGPDGAGVGQSHKNLMFWAVIAAHPSMQQYLGKTITKDTKEAALNLIKTDKDVQGAFKGIVCSACGREIKNSEFDKMIEKALNVKTGGNTLSDIQGRALNDDVVKRGISLSGTKGNLSELHQRWVRHADSVRQHNDRRADLNRRRTARRPEQTRQPTREAERV